MSSQEFYETGDIAKATGISVGRINNLLKLPGTPFSRMTTEPGVARKFDHRDFLIFAVAAHLDAMRTALIGGLAEYAVDHWLNQGAERFVDGRWKSGEDEAGWTIYDRKSQSQLTEDARFAVVIETAKICEEAEVRMADLMAVKKAMREYRAKRADLGKSRE